MADLRTRFRALDATPVPDLWPEIERRAAAGATSDAERLPRVGLTWRGARPADPGSHATRRLVLVLVLVGLLVVTLLGAVLVGSLLRDPRRADSSLAPTAQAVSMQPIQIADFNIQLEIPASWQMVPSEIVEYREFFGSVPEGHLSVGHESPYFAMVCSPTCTQVDVPGTIPYDATKQLAALRAAVAAIAGSSDWVDLEPDVLPEIAGGARIDTTAIESDGREWRRVHIVGLRERNVVAITWSQPADQFDDGLLAAVLGGIKLTPAPVYSDGDLMDWPLRGTFQMPIPGLWLDEEQPTLDGRPLSGVRRFASGRIVVSIGSPDGSLGWCDPDCRLLTGLTSLEGLEASVLEDAGLGAPIDTTLDREPARIASTPGPPERSIAVAMHGDQPVALAIDAGDYDVAPGIIEQMIAGFRFVEPEPAPTTQRLSLAGGAVELALSEAWQPVSDDAAKLVNGLEELTATVGDRRGRIVTCDVPAPGGWDRCRRVRVATLDELAAAVLPGPLDEQDIGPPSVSQDAVSLDGEPAVLTRIQGYEPESQGGQELVYIAAMHDGRPYLIRIWTSENEAVDLDSVIAGFKFVD